MIFRTLPSELIHNSLKDDRGVNFISKVGFDTRTSEHRT